MSRAALDPAGAQPGGRGLRHRLDARASARSSASILTYAAPPARRALGATLLLTYSLGLGIPFLLSGLFITRTMSAFRWMRDRWRIVNATAAAVFIMIGVLVATGRFEVITQRLSGVGFSGI